MNWREVASSGRAFLLLRQQDNPVLDFMSGDVSLHDSIGSLPWCQAADTGIDKTYICSLPFASVRTRGFPAHHEGNLKIACMEVNYQSKVEEAELLGQFIKPQLSQQPAFHLTDDEYAEIVRDVIVEEIGNGAGANFVIPRSGSGKISNMSVELALSIFSNMLRSEYGNYWSFVFYDGARYLIGATPSLHLRSADGLTAMQPMSGTYRKSASPESPETLKKNLMSFLSRPKDIFELFMVADEDLKIISGLDGKAVRMRGPYLRELSNLIHTYYITETWSDMPLADILQNSLFSPTVTGSPIQSAFRVIHKYENKDRRYYGAALACISPSLEGKPVLDSAVLIRTLEIETDGTLHFYTGSTLVKDSDPQEEMQESKAKIERILVSLGNKSEVPPRRMEWLWRDSRDVIELMKQRNISLSKYWTEEEKIRPIAGLAGESLVFLENEDNFCWMAKRMLEAMGMTVHIVPYSEFNLDDWPTTLPVIGPGPGNPMDRADDKMSKSAAVVRRLLNEKRPFVAICLGHQILCDQLGYPLFKKENPYQGLQKEIVFFGKRELVGFYNTFAARRTLDITGVEVSCADIDQEIYGLRGANFASFQFHPESILTRNGIELLKDAVLHCLGK